MKQALEELQHFGLTIHNQTRTRRFYSRTLQLPLLGETVNRSERCDRMYRLEEAVNRVTWYQIGDSGIETFYLPRHPSASIDVSDIRNPGYRYMAFTVDGFDDYSRRLCKEEVELHRGETRSGQCFRVQDPDGIYVLFFDSGREASTGRVSALKEIGLVIADPEGYEQFFDIIGLWQIEETSTFLEDIFGLDAPSPLYGHVRLICLPGAPQPTPKRCFPATEAEPRLSFSDIGIKHISYYVHDVDAFYEYGRDNGIVFLFKPEKVAGGSRITYFLDPEGNTFEAMQVPQASRMAGRIAGAIRRTQMDIFTLTSRFFGGSQD